MSQLPKLPDQPQPTITSRRQKTPELPTTTGITVMPAAPSVPVTPIAQTAPDPTLDLLNMLAKTGTGLAKTIKATRALAAKKELVDVGEAVTAGEPRDQFKTPEALAFFDRLSGQHAASKDFDPKSVEQLPGQTAADAFEDYARTVTDGQTPQFAAAYRNTAVAAYTRRLSDQRKVAEKELITTAADQMRGNLSGNPDTQAALGDLDTFFPVALAHGWTRSYVINNVVMQAATNAADNGRVDIVEKLLPMLKEVGKDAGVLDKATDARSAKHLNYLREQARVMGDDANKLGELIADAGKRATDGLLTEEDHDRFIRGIRSRINASIKAADNQYIASETASLAKENLTAFEKGMGFTVSDKVITTPHGKAITLTKAELQDAVIALKKKTIYSYNDPDLTPKQNALRQDIELLNFLHRNDLTDPNTKGILRNGASASVLDLLALEKPEDGTPAAPPRMMGRGMMAPETPATFAPSPQTPADKMRQTLGQGPSAGDELMSGVVPPDQPPIQWPAREDIEALGPAGMGFLTYLQLKQVAPNKLGDYMTERDRTFYRTTELLYKYRNPGDVRTSLMEAHKAILRGPGDVHTPIRLNRSEVDDKAEALLDRTWPRPNATNHSAIAGKLSRIATMHMNLAGVDEETALKEAAKDIKETHSFLGTHLIYTGDRSMPENIEPIADMIIDRYLENNPKSGYEKQDLTLVPGVLPGSFMLVEGEDGLPVDNWHKEGIYLTSDFVLLEHEANRIRQEEAKIRIEKAREEEAKERETGIKRITSGEKRKPRSGMLAHEMALSFRKAAGKNWVTNMKQWFKDVTGPQGIVDWEGIPDLPPTEMAAALLDPSYRVGLGQSKPPETEE